MTLWFLLAIAAPILWALNNVVDAAIRRHFIKDEWAMLWLTAMVHAVYAIPFLVLVDIGFNEPWAPWLMMLAGALWTGPLLLYYRALEFEETSRVALLMQMGPIWALILSFAFLGERLTMIQYVAFILLLLAGIFAAIKKVKETWSFSLAFGLILATGIVWAIGDVLFKYLEPQFSDFYAAFAFFFLGSAFPGFFMLMFKRIRKAIKKHVFRMPAKGWVLFVAVNSLGILGVLSFSWALVLGPVSLTSVVMGIQPLFVFIYGLFLYRLIPEISKEDMSPRIIVWKGVSLALVLIGLVLLNL